MRKIIKSLITHVDKFEPKVDKHKNKGIICNENCADCPKFLNDIAKINIFCGKNLIKNIVLYFKTRRKAVFYNCPDELKLIK